ncbi:DUF4136 domain-containing protein [Paraburkholderia caballeronis]|uniref:DUF4136 domain-containing protein n=1 Tax=Paraburkholderia caballeronis TaxID=416943 RepID=A0A1H7UT33_9BURK|nr:DUF4136 domain-containing protein [Paraburkholderia caballeronis]PXW26668.1 uncharacterized protein DUF4136 [Paraburkholderia caballeronis]PXX02214.1 uncharacterized protein DUF4136 [Paraburkholderia caballeronis]RAK01371.1 uncharacterized protein DUF4136 [Paraburkholderia caballeronis]TDV25877.1 uncharacterized protein DUF4136 [Paraburkholderia caballeronis]SEB82456.1 protein of unknown function [Paraburkholderia caballeronis]
MMPERWTRFAVTMLTACAAILSGCTTYVTSQVTAFSNWTGGSDATRTYAFARSPAQQNSIEQATYEQLVADGLATHAFRLVAEPQARYLIALAYGSRMDQVNVPQPVFYNAWAGPYWGPFNPWGPWGPFPPTFVNQTVPLYSHVLGIRITERASGHEVYNVTARTSGDEPSLVRAMPYLVRSALADFPLANGVVRTVRLPSGSGGGVPNEVAVGQGAPTNATPMPAPVPPPAPAK